MKTALFQLRFADWIVLCLAMSLIGSILAVLAFVAIDIFDAAGGDYASTNPYRVSAAFEQLTYMGLYCLFANALGAAFLFTVFALKRRIRAS